MKHYLKLDSMGVINAYSASDRAPGEGWTLIDFDPTPFGLMVGTKKRLAAGQIEDTGQPLMPTAPYMDWDEAGVCWVPNIERAWVAVRAERNKRLTASDWSTLADVPMSDETRAAWMAYRQALRDVTSQTDPLAIEWPVPPSN
jgi:hypothetical protein